MSGGHLCEYNEQKRCPSRQASNACSRRFLHPTVTLHIKTAPKSSFLLIKNTDFETPGLVYKNLEKNLKKLLTFVARFDNIYERQEQSTNECGGKRRNGP